MKKQIVGYALVYMNHGYQFVQGPDNCEPKLNFLHECIDQGKPAIALYESRDAARDALKRTMAYNTAYYKNFDDKASDYKIVPVVKHGEWTS